MAGSNVKTISTTFIRDMGSRPLKSLLWNFGESDNLAIMTVLNHDEIAFALRTEASGIWVQVTSTPLESSRAHSLVNMWNAGAAGKKWGRLPAAYRSGRFDFAATSAGYGTGVAHIWVRHRHATFDLPDAAPFSTKPST